jgi:hypothetical protein
MRDSGYKSDPEAYGQIINNWPNKTIGDGAIEFNNTEIMSLCGFFLYSSKKKKSYCCLEWISMNFLAHCTCPKYVQSNQANVGNKICGNG